MVNWHYYLQYTEIAMPPFQREITFLSTVHNSANHISSTQKHMQEVSDMITLNACHAKQNIVLHYTTL